MFKFIFAAAAALSSAAAFALPTPALAPTHAVTMPLEVPTTYVGEQPLTVKPKSSLRDTVVGELRHGACLMCGAIDQSGNQHCTWIICPI